MPTLCVRYACACIGPSAWGHVAIGPSAWVHVGMGCSHTCARMGTSAVHALRLLFASFAHAMRCSASVRSSSVHALRLLFASFAQALQR